MLDIRGKSLVAMAALMGYLSAAVGCSGGNNQSCSPPNCPTGGPPSLKSLIVTAPTSSVPAGNTLQYTANASYSDGSSRDVTNTVQWSSSDPTIASIDNTGLAKTLKQGSVTIQAALQLLTGSDKLTVAAADLSSISISPRSTSLIQGGTQQFIATGTYTDGHTSDLSSNVSWATSGPGLYLDASGFSRALLTGLYTVTATADGISNTTSVVVMGKKPRYLFTADLDGTVFSYAINSATGWITPVGFVLGDNPQQLEIDASGQYLYTCNSVSSNVSAYSVVNNGTLLPVARSPFSAASTVYSLSASPTSEFLYASTQSGIITFSVDPNSGALTAGAVLSGSPAPVITVDPTGRFLYATATTNKISAYSISKADGSLSAIPGSPFTLASTPAQIGIDPSGHFLYELGSTGIQGFAIAANGALSAAGPPVQAGGDPISLSFSPTGKNIVVRDALLNEIWAYTIAAGVLSPVAGSPFPIAQQNTPLDAICFDSSGAFVFAAENNFISTFSVNLATGIMTTSVAVLSRAPVAMAVLGGGAEVSFQASFAYVANQQSGNVSAFSISPSTGSLTQVPGSPIAVAPSVFSVEIAGSNVAVTDPVSGLVHVYPLHQDGTLGADRPVVSTNSPSGVVVDRSGKFLYVADANLSIVELYNISGGSVTNSGMAFGIGITPVLAGVVAGTMPASLVIDPSGKFLVVVNQLAPAVAVFSINPVSGVLSPAPGSPFQIPPVGPGVAPTGVAVDSTGETVIVTDGYGAFYTFSLDAVTGSLSGPLVSFPLTGEIPMSVTASQWNSDIYFPETVSGDINAAGQLAAYSLDGAAQPRALSGMPFNADHSPTALVVPGWGGFAFATNFASDDISLFSVNSASGALALVGNTPEPQAAGPMAIKILGAFK